MSLALRVAALLVAIAPHGAAAQEASGRLLPEIHADAITGFHGHRTALQVGAGAGLPMGHYVRVAGIAAVGLGMGGSSGAAPGGRVDLLARFLLDPFRQARYGLSVGGGLSARFERGERVTPLLLAAMDIEGRRRPGGWSPAVQLGVGGGVRLGVILRRGAASAR